MKTKDLLSRYSKKVLLVDDNSFFLEMGKDFFRREHLDVLTAKSGNEALDTIKEQKPDLVFMDLYMPGGDGDEFCKAIKGDDDLKSIPVVMLTSSGLSSDVERSRNAGCDDFIHKPVTREKFLDCIKKFLNLPPWSGNRKKIRMPAKYGPDEDNLFTGVAADLSVGGIFLETENLLPLDSKIHVEFKPKNDAGFIKCKGRVAWVNPKGAPKKHRMSPGMGIEFTEIKKSDILFLTGFIKKKPFVFSSSFTIVFS